MSLFPFQDYWWFYSCFFILVISILIMDLGLFHKKAHEIKLKEATIWSIIWVISAILFGFFLQEFSLWRFQHDQRLLAIQGFDPFQASHKVMLEFFTGYIVEKALSVDNIFVFVVIFTHFNIPDKYQHRILFFGILGALIFRCIFISIGAALIQYQWIVIVFGVFLLLTGLKIILAPEKPLEPEKNPILKFLKKSKWLHITEKLHGQKFIATEGGVKKATPLLICLIIIEFSDIIFAVDSVPAIFAITQEPMIVLTSNIFAILGLRAMYFLLANIVHKFRFLKYGLGAVLIFVGLKMIWLNHAFGGHFPIAWSLTIISSLITISIATSLIIPEKTVEEN